MRYKHRILWAAFFFLLCLSGCSTETIKPEQPVFDHFEIIQANKPIGQSFTARFDGLDGIVIAIKPLRHGTGNLTLDLSTMYPDGISLRTSHFLLDEIQSPQQLTFSFPPIPHSTKGDLFFQIRLEGSGAYEIAAAGPEAYLDGSLYRMDTPVDAQLQFGLRYKRIHMIHGLAHEIVGWLWWILITAFLFLLPGWVILRLVWPKVDHLWWGEKTGLALGVGVAAYPVILLFTNLIRIHPGSTLAYLPGGVALLVVLWWNRGFPNKVIRWLHKKPTGLQITNISSNIIWPDLAAFLAIITILFTRFWAIREIDVPLWGDSVQHTVITQLLLDHGGLFSSWMPYAPYTSFTMHYGFPLVAALYAWIGNLSSTTAVLGASQVINAITVISLLPLAYRISGGNRWAGGAAIIAGGLLTNVPAYYVNWGRFAQLTGEAILPATIWMTWVVLEGWASADPFISEKGLNNKRNVVKVSAKEPGTHRLPLIPSLFTGFMIAGMSLSYYRMPIYWISFIPGLVFVWLKLKNLRVSSIWSSIAPVIFISNISALFFVLPWVIRVSNSSLSRTLTSGVLNVSALASIVNEFGKWRDFQDYLSPLVWIAACIGLVWASVKKKFAPLMMGLWVVMLLGYFCGRAIRLPGANMLEMFGILIWLYLPAAIIAGWLIGEIIEAANPILHSYGAPVFAFLLIAGAWVGASQIRNITNPQTYSLATRPDLRAMAWINQNTPADARFLVQGALIYNGTTIVGTDAGWWIPLLSRRQNTMPPQYALGNETPASPDTTQNLIELVKVISERGINDPEVERQLCEQGITHVYLGQRGGEVGFGLPPLFRMRDFLASSRFHPVYFRDRVSIFEFERSICSQEEQ